MEDTQGPRPIDLDLSAVEVVQDIPDGDRTRQILSDGTSRYLLEDSGVWLLPSGDVGRGPDPEFQELLRESPATPDLFPPAPPVNYDQ